MPGQKSTRSRHMPAQRQRRSVAQARLRHLSRYVWRFASFPEMRRPPSKFQREVPAVLGWLQRAARIAPFFDGATLGTIASARGSPSIGQQLQGSGMKALVWRGTEDIRCESVPDPKIEQDRDAIIKVTSCAICGSDLHLFDHFMPGMESGDIMGHETMGEVVEVGSNARTALAVGDRVVVPFTIICGKCDQCKRGNF